MIKIAARIFDIYDDGNLEIAGQLGSEFAETKVAEVNEVQGLLDNQFGLVMKTAGGALRRRYPLHNADSIKLSRAYFDSVKPQLPDEVVAITEAKIAAAEKGEQTLADTGVPYVDMTILKPAREKVAFTEKHFGLTIGSRGYFPLHDVELVKVAISRYPISIEDIDPEERFLYARNIVKRAEALKIRIPDDCPVHLYSNDSVNLGALKVALDERRRILKSAGISTEIIDQLELAAGCTPERGGMESDDSFRGRSEKVASLIKTGAALCVCDPGRIISTLQSIDKIAGLNDYQYLRGLLDPFAACFKNDIFTKRAALIVDGVDLSTVSPEALREKFDDSFVQEFSQNPAMIYRSLPDPMKQVIKQLSGDPNAKAAPGQGHGDPQILTAPTYVNGLTMGS
jgi:hypothetical protein